MAFYKSNLVYILNKPKAKVKTGVEVITQKIVNVEVGISLLLIKTFLISLFLPIKAVLRQI